MKLTDRDAIERLASAYHAGQSLVLLSDYDGTLVPFDEAPKNARLGLETRRVLEQLTSRPRVRVGIISGRRIDELKSIVDIGSLLYAGTGGLELDLDGVTIVPPHADAARELISRTCELLRVGLVHCPNVWMERKSLGITLHHRNATGERIEALRDWVLETLQPLRKELRLLVCALGIEITPDIGFTKGSALRSIFDHVGAGCVFYAGNDVNDADPLEVAVELGGIALGIGDRAPSVAQYYLPHSLAFTHFLWSLLDRLDDKFAAGGCGLHIRPSAGELESTSSKLSNK